jgi:hypothetical protein
VSDLKWRVSYLVWKVSDVVWKVSCLVWKVSLLNWKWYKMKNNVCAHNIQITVVRSCRLIIAIIARKTKSELMSLNLKGNKSELFCIVFQIYLFFIVLLRCACNY